MDDTSLRGNEVNTNLLRALPAVDELMRSDAVAEAMRGLPSALAARAVREAVDDVRRRLSADPAEWSAATDDPALAVRNMAEAEALRRIEALRRSLLGRVVNATGVVLHTNLGRAPLSPRALQAAADAAAGYSNLEFDVPSGRRGLRDLHGETLLTALTGAEAALVVNNNAGAVLLVLSALARGREVVLSRGEMIEIGGSFRIPEVMEQSGCLLREVGTTNRTHLRDYEGAIGDETGAILKVHPSNYRVVGFTAGVDASRLAPLARRYGVPLIEDLGSGVLVDTGAYGLAREPTVQSRIAAGIDVVTFSGDKLLGGPQAGIIVGRKQFVEACRRHPLARALRVDKMTLAALQATLLDYLNGEHESIPLYEMLAAPVESLRRRAEAIRERVEGKSTGMGIGIDIVDTESTVGGGSLPGETMPSIALALRPKAETGPASGPNALAAALRRHRPPVVGRVEGDAVLLDLRTVAAAEDGEVAAALLRLMAPSSAADPVPAP